MPSMDEVNRERIGTLVEKVHEVMEDLGLYSLGYQIGTNNPDLVSEEGDIDHDVRALIEDGEASFVLSAAFRINDMAWSDRILDPDKFDTDRQFRRMMPSEDEMTAAHIKEQIAAGKDPFEDVEDEELEDLDESDD